MLSMKCKYGLRAMAVLARQDRRMQSRSIAEKAHVPAKFLEAILLELKQKSLVDSKRGVFGGYKLSRPAGEITLGDIITAIDGSLAPVACAGHGATQACADCGEGMECAIRQIMIDVRIAIAHVLEGKSLKDWIQKPKTLEDILNG